MEFCTLRIRFPSEFKSVRITEYAKRFVLFHISPRPKHLTPVVVVVAVFITFDNHILVG